MATADSAQDVAPAGEDRAHAAAAEAMVVEQIAPSMHRVVTISDTYRVDAELGACTCPDYQYRERECKHLVRVKMDLGQTPAPAVGSVVHDLEERDERDAACSECVSLPDGHECANCYIKGGSN